MDTLESLARRVAALEERMKALSPPPTGNGAFNRFSIDAVRRTFHRGVLVGSLLLAVVFLPRAWRISRELTAVPPWCSPGWGSPSFAPLTRHIGPGGRVFFSSDLPPTPLGHSFVCAQLALVPATVALRSVDDATTRQHENLRVPILFHASSPERLATMLAERKALISADGGHPAVVSLADSVALLLAD
jgi:hypothetical protein